MQKLAQFPLQLVAFPGEQVNLHIFEDRYKQLIQDCQDDQIDFGILPFVNGQIQEVGTVMRLQSIEKAYSDGRMDVKTCGIGQYRILEFFAKDPTRLYPSAVVEPYEIDPSVDTIIRERLVRYLQELFELLDIDSPVNEPDIDNASITHKLRLELEQEYEILTLPSAVEKHSYLVDILEQVMPSVREAADLRRKIQMNGQYKHIIPPNIS